MSVVNTKIVHLRIWDGAIAVEDVIETLFWSHTKRIKVDLEPLETS